MNTPSQYRPGLNQVERLADRFARSLERARRVHIGVAYAKSSGVASLLRAGLPVASRAVIGLGFGLTDPLAVEQLDSAGVSVRVVPDAPELAASAFHPKLYLVERPNQLTAFSASSNLTGAGWTTNVEQFEELTFEDPSPGARLQRERFEQLWDLGQDLATVRRAGEWERYRQRAHDRRTLEREDRRRLLRLQAATGQLLGMLARRPTRTAPGYLAVTNDRWWELQLGLRGQTDVALFWRRNIKDFRALEPGGVMFHLVKDPAAPEELRAVRGFSTYDGTYEVEDAGRAFRRHGALLGVTTITELHERLSIEPGSAIGIIHLHELTEVRAAGNTARAPSQRGRVCTQHRERSQAVAGRSRDAVRTQRSRRPRHAAPGGRAGRTVRTTMRPALAGRCRPMPDVTYGAIRSQYAG